MSDLGDNIRRIAGTKELKRKIDELQKLLEGVKNKSTIKSHTSIAYASGSGSSSSNARQDTETDEAAGVGAGGATAANGYTGNMGSLFDNQPAVGAELKALDGFFDCNTGAELLISLDDQYIQPDYGDVYDGYSGNTDPRQSQFLSGVHYELTVLTPHQSSSVYDVVSAGLPEYDSNDAPNAPHTIASIAEYDETALTDGNNISVTLSRGTGVQFQINVTARVGQCTVGVDSYCPATSTNNPWPADGVHQVAFDGAQFKTSDLEPTADKNNKWDNNPSKIQGCDTNGNQVTLTPTGGGGISIDYDGTDKHIEQKDGVITVVTGTWS